MTSVHRSTLGECEAARQGEGFAPSPFSFAISTSLFRSAADPAVVIFQKAAPCRSPDIHFKDPSVIEW